MWKITVKVEIFTLGDKSKIEVKMWPWSEWLAGYEVEEAANFSVLYQGQN